MRLIVVTDPVLAGARGVHETVEAALRAGARAVQLRDKRASAGMMLEQARELRSLTRRYGALLFVNDRPDVALAAAADGVHLGPDDLPIAAARRVVPENMLIGFSTDEPSAARHAVGEGADYIGCGTVFPTTSKAGAGDAIGVDGLRAVVRAVRVPVIGIGGITASVTADVCSTGAAGVAVVGAVMAASDPFRATSELLEAAAECAQAGGSR